MASYFPSSRVSSEAKLLLDEDRRAQRLQSDSAASHRAAVGHVFDGRLLGPRQRPLADRKSQPGEGTGASQERRPDRRRATLALSGRRRVHVPESGHFRGGPVHVRRLQFRKTGRLEHVPVLSQSKRLDSMESISFFCIAFKILWD